MCNNTINAFIKATDTRAPIIAAPIILSGFDSNTNKANTTMTNIPCGNNFDTVKRAFLFSAFHLLPVAVNAVYTLGIANTVKIVANMIKDVCKLPVTCSCKYQVMIVAGIRKIVASCNGFAELLYFSTVVSRSV